MPNIQAELAEAAFELALVAHYADGAATAEEVQQAFAATTAAQEMRTAALPQNADDRQVQLRLEEVRVRQQAVGKAKALLMTGQATFQQAHALG